MKKIIALLLSAVMSVVILPINVTASEKEAPESAQISGIDEIREQSYSTDTFASEDGYKIKTTADKPECFDLRHVDENGVEKSYITPVKVQNPYGACWGFGAISAAESSILSSGIAGDYDVNTLDLSEKQLAWFAANAIADKTNSQYGEGAVFKKGYTVQDRYNIGGGTGFATNLFASGIGPIEEDAKTEDGYIFAYRGKNGEVNSEYVTWVDDEGNEHSGVRKTSYSDEDDWAMPEKYRFSHSYQLRESFLLPNPVNDDGEYNPEATDAIKEQLLNKRAVSISFQATHSVAGEDTSETKDYTMSENWAQYCDIPAQNHVVTIVGYDDNYPKSNFVKDNQPPGDGAWLVKNSWGSDLNDFPNNGYAHWGLYEGQDIPGSDYKATSKKHTGYFWLSYYDASIYGPEAYIFENSDPDIIYNQHDYMVVAEYGEYATKSVNKMSNVFTAKQNEELRDISVFTVTPGTKIRYQVYLLAENAQNPEDGVCVASSDEISFDFGGYHRIALNSEKPIYLCKGQKYAVVVCERTPGGKYSLSFGINDIEPRHDSNPRLFHSVINKGESFLYIDGKWRDMSDKEMLDMLLADENGFVWNKCADNFPIKAFTAPSPSDGAYLVVTNRNKYNITESITLRKTEEMPLLAQFKGAVDELESFNPGIVWTSSDPEILSVNTVEGNSFKAIIKGNKPGTVYLTVDTGKYGKRVIRVNVRKFEVISAGFKENIQFVYNKKQKRPKLDYVSAETEDEYETESNLKRGRDYTITYFDNVRCGRATAQVNGIGEYGGVVENNEVFLNLSFIIVPARAKIKKVTKNGRKLKVKFKSQKASGISGYVVTCKEVGSKRVITKKVKRSATSAVIKGLKKGKTYKVKLRAYVKTYDKDAVYNEEWDCYEPGYAEHFGKASKAVKVKI